MPRKNKDNNVAQPEANVVEKKESNDMKKLDGSPQLVLIQKKLRNRRKQLTQAENIAQLKKENPNVQLEPEQKKKLANIEVIRTLVNEYETLVKGIEEIEEDINKKNKEKLKEQRRLEGAAAKSVVQLYSLLPKLSEATTINEDESKAIEKINSVKDIIQPAVNDSNVDNDDFWAKASKPILSLLSMPRTGEIPDIKQAISSSLVPTFTEREAPVIEKEETEVTEKGEDEVTEDNTGADEKAIPTTETQEVVAEKIIEVPQKVMMPTFMGESFLQQSETQQIAAEEGLHADPCVLGVLDAAPIPSGLEGQPQQQRKQQQNQQQQHNDKESSRGRGRGRGGRNKRGRGRGGMNGDSRSKGKNDESGTGNGNGGGRGRGRGKQSRGRGGR